jgi:hypothetical protein
MTKGHRAVCDEDSMKIFTELHVKETVRAVGDTEPSDDSMGKRIEVTFLSPNG